MLALKDFGGYNADSEKIVNFSRGRKWVSEGYCQGFSAGFLLRV